MPLSLGRTASHSNQPRGPACRRPHAHVSPRSLVNAAAGLTVAALLRQGRVLLPFPFPMLLAVGSVMPVALPHQRHPHAHVQGPVACEKVAFAALSMLRRWLTQMPRFNQCSPPRRKHQLLFILFSLDPGMSQTCPFCQAYFTRALQQQSNKK